MSRNDLGNMNPSKFEKHGATLENVLKEKRVNLSTVYDNQIMAASWARTQTKMDEHERSGRKLMPLLIQAPRGSGKTGVIVLLPYFLEARRVLIITNSEVRSNRIGTAFGAEYNWRGCFFDEANVVKQGSVEREHFLSMIVEDVGIIKQPSDGIKMNSNVVIVSAQRFGGYNNLSLYQNENLMVGNAKSFFKNFDLLLLDEAHRYPMVTLKQLVEVFGKPVYGGKMKKIVFLSATPCEGGATLLEEFCNCPERVKRIAPSFEADSTKKIGRDILFLELEHDYKNDSKVLFRDLQQVFTENEKRDGSSVHYQGIILVPEEKNAERLVWELNAVARSVCYAADITGKESGRSLSTCKVGITSQIGTAIWDNPNVLVCAILMDITEDVGFGPFLDLLCAQNQRALETSIQGIVLTYREFGPARLWEQLIQKLSHEEDEDSSDSTNGKEAHEEHQGNEEEWEDCEQEAGSNAMLESTDGRQYEDSDERRIHHMTEKEEANANDPEPNEDNRATYITEVEVHCEGGDSETIVKHLSVTNSSSDVAGDGESDTVSESCTSYNSGYESDDSVCAVCSECCQM